MSVSDNDAGIRSTFYVSHVCFLTALQNLICNLYNVTMVSRYVIIKIKRYFMFVLRIKRLMFVFPSYMIKM